MPQNISIPLMDKISIWQILSKRSCQVHLMVKKRWKMVLSGKPTTNQKSLYLWTNPKEKYPQAKQRTSHILNILKIIVLFFLQNGNQKNSHLQKGWVFLGSSNHAEHCQLPDTMVEMAVWVRILGEYHSIKMDTGPVTARWGAGMLISCPAQSWDSRWNIS